MPQLGISTTMSNLACSKVRVLGKLETIDSPLALFLFPTCRPALETGQRSTNINDPHTKEFNILASRLLSGFEAAYKTYCRAGVKRRVHTPKPLEHILLTPRTTQIHMGKLPTRLYTTQSRRSVATQFSLYVGRPSQCIVTGLTCRAPYRCLKGGNKGIQFSQTVIRGGSCSSLLLQAGRDICLFNGLEEISGSLLLGWCLGQPNGRCSGFVHVTGQFIRYLKPLLLFDVAREILQSLTRFRQNGLLVGCIGRIVRLEE
jgi:hypothetical protein